MSGKHLHSKHGFDSSSMTWPTSYIWPYILHPASFNKPFIVGFVGFENISIMPGAFFIVVVELVDDTFKCLIMKSSSLIIDLIGALVDDEWVAVVVVVMSGTFVSSNAFACNKSSMKLVRFDDIFLKPDIVVLCFSFCWFSLVSFVWFIAKVGVFSVEVKYDLCSWIVEASVLFHVAWMNWKMKEKEKDENKKLAKVLVLLIEGLQRIFVLAISIWLAKYCVLNKSIMNILWLK